jgi:hypothetical protein
MIRRFQSYIAFFFLALFLAPTLVQEVHAIGHEEEFHCDSLGETHIHIQHTSCDLCDFVIPVVSVPSSFQASLSLTCFGEYIFPCHVEFDFSHLRPVFISLRAPPAIS